MYEKGALINYVCRETFLCYLPNRPQPWIEFVMFILNRGKIRLNVMSVDWLQTKPESAEGGGKLPGCARGDEMKWSTEVERIPSSEGRKPRLQCFSCSQVNRRSSVSCLRWTSC